MSAGLWEKMLWDRKIIEIVYMEKEHLVTVRI